MWIYVDGASSLAGVGAIDVGGRRQAVLAAGIINGLGSMIEFFQGELINILDTEYDSVFHMLIGVSVMGIFGTLYLAKRSNLASLHCKL